MLGYINLKMKVLMVDYFSSNNLYSIELCSQLQQYCDLTLVTVENSQVQTAEKYKIIRKLYGGYKGKKIQKIVHYIKSIIFLFKMVARGKYDIIHIQGFANPKIETFLYRIFKPKSTMLFFTVHNVFPHEEKKEKASHYMALFFNKISGFVFHNNYSKAVFLNFYKVKHSKLYIIPHGCFSNSFSSLDYSIEKEENYFLTFGLIRKYKGIDVLIKAIDYLVHEEKVTNVHFIIAGKLYPKLDDTDYISIIKNSHLEEMITFIPKRLSEKEMADLFFNCKACVFPYKKIYGSGSLLMAYTFDKPVIVSNIPSFVEETNNGETGILFENENPVSLAHAIGKFLSLTAEEKQTMKNNISVLCTEKYNWRKSANLLFNAYLDLYQKGIKKNDVK